MTIRLPPPGTIWEPHDYPDELRERAEALISSLGLEGETDPVTLVGTAMVAAARYNALLEPFRYETEKGRKRPAPGELNHYLGVACEMALSDVTQSAAVHLLAEHGINARTLRRWQQDEPAFASQFAWIANSKERAASLLDAAPSIPRLD